MIWGCKAVVRLPDPKRKTLGEKGIDCIFVGYIEWSQIELNQVTLQRHNDSRVGISPPSEPDVRVSPHPDYKAYRFYVIEPNDSVSIKSIIESRDAIFDESRFSSIYRPKNIMPNLEESQRDDYSDDVPSRILEPRKGINYFDTYAPVARITTIRLLLTLATIHNLVIYQMDVKIIFLNGDLDEEVYMKKPKGFVISGDEHKVCKLVKSLYELKQAPKQWHQKFDEVVMSSGFHLNQSDKSSMKDMREADVSLGIKIKRENKEIVITQSHYIEKILRKFNREDCSLVSTPIESVEKLNPNIEYSRAIGYLMYAMTSTRPDIAYVVGKLKSVEKLNPNIGKPVDQLEYSRAIGYLMYAMTSTRPDIAYVVGKLSKFTSNPSRQRWKAITRVFKYLRGTMNYGLSYVGYPSVLEVCSDASWINHDEDLSSTSRWVFLLGRGVISWASKKQT
nr:zinc finger, CCHC-type [Tanacetum cinerariifolium]